MAGRLFDSPGHVVGKLLRDLSLGVAGGGGSVQPWQVFVDDQADQPDRVITVYNTSGRFDAYTQPDKERVGPEGVQLRIRAERGSPAWDKVNEIALAFDNDVEHNTVIIPADQYSPSPRSYHVASVSRQGMIVNQGFDGESKRRVFTFNALVYVRQIS